MTIKLIRTSALEGQTPLLKEEDLVIDPEGRLWLINFVHIPLVRSSMGNAPAKIVAKAEYHFANQCWYRSLGANVTLFATADNESEAIDFAQEVQQYHEAKEREIARLEENFLVACRMLADEIIT